MRILEAYEHQRDEIVDFRNIDITYEYNKLNRQLFDNKLPFVPISFTNAKSRHGAVKKTINRLTGKVTLVGMVLSKFLSVPYHVFLNTLAHEMIHVYQWANFVREENGNHGPVFYEQMNRINSMGLGFNVTVKLDSSDLPVAGHIKVKPLAVILFNYGSTKGIAVMDTKLVVDSSGIDKVWNYATRTRQVDKVEGDLYICEIANLLKRHINRSLKSLSWSSSSNQELEDKIRTEGKHLGHFVAEKGETRWS